MRHLTEWEKNKAVAFTFDSPCAAELIEQYLEQDE